MKKKFGTIICAIIIGVATGIGLTCILISNQTYSGNCLLLGIGIAWVSAFVAEIVKNGSARAVLFDGIVATIIVLICKATREPQHIGDGPFKAICAAIIMSCLIAAIFSQLIVKLINPFLDGEE